MKLPFTKMHGLGNDFVVIESITQPRELSAEQVRKLADRQFGIGCDQLLWVGLSKTPDVDFKYRIFNADGSEVSQCGNGARCFARYVYDQGFTRKKTLTVETHKGILRPTLEDDGQVTVDMGKPHFAPADIPFQAEAQAVRYPIVVGNDTLEIGAVSLGNPHAVVHVTDVDTAPVEQQGPLLESHRRFPERVNAGFMQVLSPNQIRLRVYERGSGETLACGSGACAAVIVGQLWGLLGESVQVNLRGGDLRIQWDGNPEHSVLMTGPAVTVFEGTVEI